MKQEQKTVDCTPSWSYTANVYTTVLQHGNDKGKDSAIKGIKQMAHICDNAIPMRNTLIEVYDLFVRTGHANTKIGKQVFDAINLLNDPRTPFMMLSVDKNTPVTFSQFVADNTAPDVDPLTEEELNEVRNMKVGERKYFGHNVEVKRIS